MTPGVEIQGLDGLESRLSAALEAALPGAAAGMKTGLALVVRGAKEKCPHSSQELRKSIGFQVRKERGQITGEAGSHLNYAGYVEMGTGPVGAKAPHPHASAGYYSTGEYVFTAKRKNGKRVHFVTDGWVYPVPGGGYRFTRGQPARPYLWPAWKENKKKVELAIRQGVKKALREVAKGGS